MKLEIEQKFRVDDPSALQAKLATLGAVFRHRILQRDAYFNHPSRDFAVSDEALRIRSVGDDNVITYKGPKLGGGVKTRREIELPIGSGRETAEQLGEILKLLGFRPSAVVEKRRTPGEVTVDGVHYELALDDVDGIGTFFEVELVVDDAEKELAQGRIHALQAKLGLVNVEPRSYLRMVLERTTSAAGE
jgi:adenylate cyclase class 2